MAHQVIARKWRPQDFGSLIGQSHISQTLINALRGDRIPHVLLFTGPRGTGKTSSARIFAKSLRCENSKDFIPCNKCTSCEDITSGRAVDVVEIDGASNNGVDAIRELRETVGYMPSSGKFKIYIIDEVHMLSGSAFNALLKTLEEPPPHVVFVLATTEVQKIPNTILSRCQRFDFRRIPARLISEHLKTICDKEKVKFEDEALWLVARQGDGSMRDSQSLLEQVISFSDGKITSQKVIDVLGLTDRALLLDAISAIVRRDQVSVIQVIEKLFGSGYDPSIFAQDLVEEIRHLMLIKVIQEDSSPAIDLSDEEIAYLRDLSSELSTEDVHMIFDMSLKGVNELLMSQDSRVVLEMLLLRMAAAPRIMELTQINWTGNQTSASTPAPQSKATVNPATKSVQKKTPQQEKPALEKRPAGADHKWIELVERIKSVNAMVGAKLDHVKFVSLDGSELKLQIPEKYKFLSGQIDSDDFKKKLKNYTKTFWDMACNIEFVDFSEKPAMTAHETKVKQAEDEQANIRTEVESHPLVKTAKDLFNSEITSIKERP